MFAFTLGVPFPCHARKGRSVDPDGKYLIEDYTFNYLGSGRNILGFGMVKGTPSKSLVIGDPDSDLDETGVRSSLKKLAIAPGEAHLCHPLPGHVIEALLPPSRKGLVMSMWSVPDKETRELMVSFYTNVLQKKMKRPEALRRAILAEMSQVKQRYDTTNPFFWRVFVYLGEP